MEIPVWDKSAYEASLSLQVLLDKPIPDNDGDFGVVGFFDPWDYFGLFGSYDLEFDRMALKVLQECETGEFTRKRDDLGSNMFREILCYRNLCDYGTSPRSCFPTRFFKPQVPVLRKKWKDYAIVQWSDWETFDDL